MCTSLKIYNSKFITKGQTPILDGDWSDSISLW